MTKEELLEKLKTSYNSVQLRGWVEALPSGDSSKRIRPNVCKTGDVYYHQGFKHPIVLLKRVGKNWLACSLTSDAKCANVLEQCKSRFFGKSYFTTTLSLIHAIEIGDYMGIYDNPKHLREIFYKIKLLMKV